MNLLSEAPPEVLVQFSSESVEKNIRSESNARYEKLFNDAIAEEEYDNEIGGAQA